MKSAAGDTECRFTPGWQPGTDSNLQRAGKQPSSACACGWPEKECLHRVLGNGPPFPPEPCEPKAEASSAAQDRFKPILIRTRTRVVERTNLETDGENWRGRCSCGWITPTFRRRKTAERHVNLHYEARANG